MSFSSGRTFKIWDYRVGHNQLLLRSPESPGMAGNVDVIFVGVDYFDIPTRIDGLEFVEPTDSEIAHFDAQVSRAHRSSEVFCLTSRDRRYFVVGVAFWVVENNLDTCVSSLETPGFGRPEGAIDRVLDRSRPAHASRATV